MKPLHELAEALVVLAREGWTPPDRDAASLAQQVRELEAQQAQSQEVLQAVEYLQEACEPDATRERWLRLQRRVTSTRLQLARLNEAEVYLRAELERQVWLARHLRARAEAQQAAA
ncbi:hypothetical protein D7V80_11830 [Corallococcus sp. CA054B]|uniref:hypothetical protein n=1 Tax=Corallococcus sp. CA054B TaxID=2316734 RepID=UPI000EA3CD45|nr:hypothetical protein [Corallococcus sp. CA054B]RKG68679.1 hypothetical protein D7V80_11830 [Corallococcus sp. CA054B]